MRDQLLLEVATTLGYRLAMAGAETYRVEESVTRVLSAYGYEAEVFAIPNCITVSIITADGKPMTRMRRIGNHGNDMDAVEKFSALSRALCNRTPNPLDAKKWLEYADSLRCSYSIWMKMVGYYLGAFGFAIFFGGNIADAIGAGFCGLLILAADIMLEKLESPAFFRTILSSFGSAMLAYTLHAAGLIANADATIIGALMILVPGLLFTNAMRDIMYGDTNSGLHRVVQVLLIAVAIALGTAGALNIATALWGAPVGKGLTTYGAFMLNVSAFIGCFGFAIYFNIHGPGILLCTIGGVISWSAYMITVHFTGSAVVGNLMGGVAASIYSEIMARVRKYPAISYLVVAIFPLLPGAGVYYTMSFAVAGEMNAFAEKGFETAAAAGAIALGILLVSSIFRLWGTHQANKRKKN